MSLAVCALCTPTGCVPSDMITEKVIDNNPESRIDESLSPVLVNSVNATVKTDALPRLDDEDDAQAREEEEKMPEYDGDTSNVQEQLAAPKTEYSQSAPKAGKAKSKDSAKAKNKKKETDDSDTGDEAKGSSSKSKKSKKSKKTEDTKESTSTGTSGKTKTKSSGTGDRYTNEDGDEPVIPDNIDHVAAVGNNAVIVSLIAGTENATALVACDEEVQQKASKVLKKRGISKPKALWNNDGSSEGDMSSSNLKKLYTDTECDLVFVTEGSETLTESQMNKLAKQNVDVYELPELTSAAGIRKAVQIVGETLAKGGVEGAEDNYKEYLAFHDDLVSKYVDRNGGMTGGFDFDEGKKADAASETMVTLYIDGWDAKARYDDPYGYLNTSKGIATAALGYGSSPVSYYLSVGGVLNNAASSIIRKEDTDGRGIVWQFFHSLNWKFSKWEGLETADFDLYASIGGGRFWSCLLWYTSSTSGDDGSDGSGYGLGTDLFPAVVTKSQAIAESVSNSAAHAKQPYYPYPSINPGDTGTTVGYFLDATEENFVQSCIGAGQRAGTVLEDGTLYGIYANPKGLAQESADDALCSWTDGSPESVLEASWAYWKFRGGSEDDFEDDVKDYYSTFYGYDLSSSELKAIKAGVKE